MSVSNSPTIILVRPQMGENIGSAARAMLNCGLTELRLVAPRDGWPNEKAVANAAGADALINNAKLYPTLPEAVADLEFVYAAAGRSYTLNKPVDNLEQASSRIRRTAHCGILFGPERTGLEAEDIIHASRILTIPLNPAFSSLNLAQAVLLVAYAWYSADGVPPLTAPEAGRAATQGELNGLLQHLTTELDEAGFFTSPNKRPSMIRSLAALFARMEPTEQDVLTLRGVVKALSRKKKL